jgi:hypothetical protein
VKKKINFLNERNKMKQSTKTNLLFAFIVILITVGSIASCLTVSQEMTKAEQNYTNNN